MTREEYYAECLKTIGRHRCLLLEASTGYGKTKLAIDLVNHLCDTVYKSRKVRMLLLVAKRVHKGEWQREFDKWGGIKADEVVTECYESLRKHTGETFDICVMDECHHIASETRMELLRKVRFTYCIGLSATIPYEVKQFFKWNYRAQVIKCDIVEAIEDEVLPEPQILLLPLKLDNTQYTETWEVNPKAPGMVYEDEYCNKWQYIKQRKHAVLRCTQKQKSNELNQEVLSLKNRYMATRNEGVKNIWLQKCGLRLEFYAASKIPVVKEILMKLKNFRTITFCKTIEHCEQLGKNCIHSKNGKMVMEYYNDFNAKKIKHITAVNMLNEGANLVDCKYGIFGNLSASEICMKQRQGRLLRHKEPVMIIPYYEGTREEELVQKAFEDYNKNCIKVIHSIDEII